jgi:Lrp/AsnC ligand binding domain
VVLSGFEQLVASWPETRECHMIRGGGDFLLRLVARDTAHENRLTRMLTGAPHVSRVQTLQTIRTSSDLAGVPLFDEDGQLVEASPEPGRSHAGTRETAPETSEHEASEPSVPAHETE